MNKRHKKDNVQVTVVKNASTLGQITKKQLLSESITFDREQYKPILSLHEKEVLIPYQNQKRKKNKSFKVVLLKRKNITKSSI